MTNHNNAPDDGVLDETEEDSAVAPEKYAISSFGIDFDVEGLVRRLRKDEIFVPHFQRNYVWKQREASQFVESLLLGLPVPGVFLAKERESQRLLIIDGQQRLKTLQFFYDGFFNPEEGDVRKTVFQLRDVQPQFEGKTYESLGEEDRRRLDNSVIHATVIKQESPSEDEDTSLFYIFGRLNSGGRRLNTQEIRSALYHGPLVDLVEKLNMLPAWRAVFGPTSERLKDQELIVRFLALYLSKRPYTRPMEEFLNRFCARHQNGPPEFLRRCEETFANMIELAHAALGAKAFRPARAINAAVFDSTAVALARRLERGPINDRDGLLAAHRTLAANPRYLDVTSRATSDESNVLTRLALATEAFAQIA